MNIRNNVADTLVNVLIDVQAYKTFSAHAIFNSFSCCIIFL